MPVRQYEHQTVTRLRLVIQRLRAGFICPKCEKFAYLHTRQDQSELHLKI